MAIDPKFGIAALATALSANLRRKRENALLELQIKRQAEDRVFRETARKEQQRQHEERQAFERQKYQDEQRRHQAAETDRLRTEYDAPLSLMLNQAPYTAEDLAPVMGKGRQYAQAPDEASFVSHGTEEGPVITFDESKPSKDMLLEDRAAALVNAGRRVERVKTTEPAPTAHGGGHKSGVAGAMTEGQKATNDRFRETRITKLADKLTPIARLSEPVENVRTALNENPDVFGAIPAGLYQNDVTRAAFLDREQANARRNVELVLVTFLREGAGLAQTPMEKQNQLKARLLGPWVRKEDFLDAWDDLQGEIDKWQRALQAGYRQDEVEEYGRRYKSGAPVLIPPTSRVGAGKPRKPAADAPIPGTWEAD
jgi:hypothetical protein